MKIMYPSLKATQAASPYSLHSVANVPALRGIVPRHEWLWKLQIFILSGKTFENSKTDDFAQHISA